MSRQLSHFLRSLTASFRPPYLYAHAVAIVGTLLIVMSGLDWWYFEHTRSLYMQYPMVLAGIIGFFVPVLVPLFIFFLSIRHRSPSLKNAASIVVLAEAASWIIATAYKVFSGRTQPEFMTHVNTIDISHDFHFGFLQHGIYWGWPSAHAATACAMAAALFILLRTHPLVRYLAIPYAIYLTLGASIGFHWLSDALAGALIGTAIGASVARRYGNDAHDV